MRPLGLAGCVLTVMAIAATTSCQDSSESSGPPSASPTVTPTSVTSSPPAPVSPQPSKPPITLNPVERTIVQAAARLGVKVTQAEHSYQNAAMWARFADGSELHLFAHRPGVGDPFSTISERTLSGTRVRRIRYGTGGSTRDMFICRKLQYEVTGAAPPGFHTLDQFIARFITELDCH